MIDVDKTGEITFKDLSLRLKVNRAFRSIRSAIRRKRSRYVAASHIAEMLKTYVVHRDAHGWSCNFGGER